MKTQNSSEIMSILNETLNTVSNYIIDDIKCSYKRKDTDSKIDIQLHIKIDKTGRISIWDKVIGISTNVANNI